MHQLVLSITIASLFVPTASFGGRLDTRDGVRGTTFAQPFAPTHVFVHDLQRESLISGGKLIRQSQSYVLRFQNGEGFLGPQFIEAWISLPSTAALEELVLTQNSAKISHLVVSNPTEARTYTSNFQYRIEFGRLENGRIPGRVELKTPNGDTIKGTFRATYRSPFND